MTRPILIFLTLFCVCINAERKLYSDVISHVSKKPYIGNANDLLKIGNLRFFSIGLTEGQLQSVFQSTATTQSFDARQGTIVRGNWKFGSIQVLELTPTNDWREPQQQEFELRLGGRVQWAQRLSDPGWFTRNILGSHFDYDYSSHSDAKPFAVIVDDTFVSMPSGLRHKIDAAGIPIIHWSTAQENFATEVKTLLIRHARAAELERVRQKAYNDCLMEARRERTVETGEAERRGFMHAVNQLKSRERQPEVPNEVVLEGHCNCDHLCELIQDVITMTPMEDPVLNVRNGQSYSRASITRWLQDHDTDPMRAETDLDDLVPNRHLNDLIEALRPYCN